MADLKAATQDHSGHLPSANFQFYVTSFWAYRPDGVAHVLKNAKAAITVPGCEITYDPDNFWFKIMCLKTHAETIKQKFCSLLLKVAEDLDWEDVVNDDGTVKDQLNHPMILSLRESHALRPTHGVRIFEARHQLPLVFAKFEFTGVWKELDETEAESVTIRHIMSLPQQLLSIGKLAGTFMMCDVSCRVVYVGGDSREAVDNTLRKLTTMLMNWRLAFPVTEHLFYAEGDKNFQVDARRMAAINPGLVTSTVLDTPAWGEYDALHKGVSLRICCLKPGTGFFRSLFGPRAPPCDTINVSRRRCSAFDNWTYTPKQRETSTPDYPVDERGAASSAGLDSGDDATKKAFVNEWINATPDKFEPPRPTSPDFAVGFGSDRRSSPSRARYHAQSLPEPQQQQQQQQRPHPQRQGRAHQQVTAPASIQGQGRGTSVPARQPAASSSQATGRGQNRRSGRGRGSSAVQVSTSVGWAPANASAQPESAWAPVPAWSQPPAAPPGPAWANKGRGQASVPWPALPSRAPAPAAVNPGSDQTRAQQPGKATPRVQASSASRRSLPAATPVPTSSQPSDDGAWGWSGRPPRLDSLNEFPALGNVPQPAAPPRPLDVMPPDITFDMEPLVPERAVVPSQPKSTVQARDDEDPRLFRETMNQRAPSRAPGDYGSGLLAHPRADPHPAFIEGLEDKLAGLAGYMRSRPGRIQLRAVFGRICLKDFTESGLARNTQNEDSNGWLPAELLGKMDEAYGSPSSYIFTDILSIYGQDADTLATFPKAGLSTEAPWKQFSRRVTYEFLCCRQFFRDGSPSQMKEDFVVEVDSKTFAYRFRRPGDRLAPILVHCLHRHWDVQLLATYTPTEALEQVYASFARRLVDSLEIVPNSRGPPCLSFENDEAKVLHQGDVFKTTVEDIRVRHVARYISANSNTYLDVSQVQRMGWLTSKKSEGRPATKFPQVVIADEHPRKGRFATWVEASLSSVEAEEMFLANETLDLGDEPPWTVEKLRASGCFEALWKPALAMVKDMDGIGVLTNNGLAVDESGLVREKPKTVDRLEANGFW